MAKHALTRGANWLRSSALPLWGTAGFDRERKIFFEQLDFEGKPVLDLPRRLMVQARQISVFASAALNGWFPPGRELALTAAERMITLFHRPDGAPGWVKSIDDELDVADSIRDLYAQAFALFALSWLYRLSPDPKYLMLADATITFIDSAMAVPNGGYMDTLPASSSVRRQNPHMHLFEAFLGLYEATKKPNYLVKATAMKTLLLGRFVDSRKSYLREYFRPDWSIYPAQGDGRMEPGHHFEWRWLLHKYGVVSKEPSRNLDSLRRAATALFDQAVTVGITGDATVYDEFDESGAVTKRSSRFWPHTEALRANAVELLAGRAECGVRMVDLMDRIQSVFALESLKGGWMDHVDVMGGPLSETMPASSLYHVYFGVAESLQLLDKGGL